MLLDPALEVVLEFSDRRVVVFDQSEIEFDALASIEVFKDLRDSLAIGPVGDPRGRGREVVLVMGVLDVGEQARSLADHVESSAQQISCGTKLGRIRVCLGEAAPSEHGGNLEGIDLVVLGFASVNGLHVEGVPEDELDVLRAA